MPDNTIPPIPPGCEHFEIERYFYFVLPNNSSWSIPLCNPGRWRPIIAAMARCAWLDEAARICNATCGDEDIQALLAARRGGMTITPETISEFLVVNSDEEKQAEANARAWREWGMIVK